MALDPELLRILRCPRARAPLIYFEDEGFLFCPESRLRYAVRDDVPVMLVIQQPSECESFSTSVAYSPAASTVCP